jgi:hypothetical protein
MISAEDRQPAVAGRFYPGDPARLGEDVARLLGDTRKEPGREAYALMAPHAGYVYSGAVAGATYARVRVPSQAVVLCPNHTGRGVRRSLWSSGQWNMPGGAVPIAGDLARAIRDAADLDDDHAAHLGEHAIEVQLPFLQGRRSDVSIVPICLAGLSLGECHELGEGLARAISASPGGARGTLLVASSDMSHYVPADVAKRLDSLALDRVGALDPDGLYDVVTRHDISMCGFIPMTVALVAALRLGATGAELVRYANSGDASGDYQSVVGYAGVVVY